MDEFEKQAKEMTTYELEIALTTEQYLYTNEAIAVLKKEYEKRKIEQKKEKTQSGKFFYQKHQQDEKQQFLVEQKNLYTTDTKMIVRTHITVRNIILSSTVILTFCAFVLFMTFCFTPSANDDPVNWWISAPALIVLFAAPVIGYFSLLLYNILFGFFYDTRKMRMMMEENQSKK